MSFFMPAPSFLANSPEWQALYQTEREAMTAAEARAKEAGKGLTDARKAADDARAARKAGKKAEPEQTCQERITHAELRADAAAKAVNDAAAAFYKAWMGDDETLARYSREALSQCVEAGRAAVAMYEDAFANYRFSIQRVNADGAYVGKVLGANLSRGIGLNDSSKIADSLKFLKDSTEALAGTLALFESGEIAKAAQRAEAEAQRRARAGLLG